MPINSRDHAPEIVQRERDYRVMIWADDRNEILAIHARCRRFDVRIRIDDLENSGAFHVCVSSSNTHILPAPFANASEKFASQRDFILRSPCLDKVEKVGEHLLAQP